MLRFVVLSAFLLASQLVSGCEDSHTHTKLNLTRYQGTWNLYGFIEPEPFTGQKHRCVSESYFKRDDNRYLLDTIWNGTINGERVSQPGIIILQSSHPSGASSWEMYMDGGRFDAHVLATDYTDWALERTCGSVPVEGEPDIYFERVMIRSRTTYLAAGVLNTLITMLESYGYDARNLELVEHTNCGV